MRIRSYVREVPAEAQVEPRSQRVAIERRPVDLLATAADLSTGDHALEARESREEAVVAKEARVVEEIGLCSQEETQTQARPDTVRKTEAEVVDERTGKAVSDEATLA